MRQGNPAALPRQRLDLWLWQARFFKTRALAAAVVSSGHLRLNGAKVGKPGHGVTPGDVLGFVQADRLRLVRVLGLAQRRGPSIEAQTLYLDLDAPSSPLE
ncbi:RNA-binding S4 domain-containing protein [Rhodobacter ferrooxidans]|uniref:RNA-binding S4 domain protein n=1 Tax=Rhodobacter ferrooxidans TaxID=371731 RepID=C8S485_9RHOB|nr:RNA-binding S4 domain-containing protein [Rhodobacter sp. SW2]EEW24199.1 RNA-binding S4 domain protein [Rhodobacter sp. SW2]